MDLSDSEGMVIFQIVSFLLPRYNSLSFVEQ